MASWSAWRSRICAALVLGAISTQAAWAVPVLSTVATPSPAIKGSPLSVDVLITGITDLYSFQYTLSFDASVLQATSVTEGAFLASAGNTFFGGGTIDNTAGTISFTFDTLLGAVSGANGSGLLARINFGAVNGGTSALAFSDVTFLNSAIADITVQVQNGSVSVSAVPEPATLALLCVGLAGLAVARQRKAG